MHANLYVHLIICSDFINGNLDNVKGQKLDKRKKEVTEKKTSCTFVFFCCSLDCNRYI